MTLTASGRSLASLGLLLFCGVLLLSTPQAALLPLLDRDEPRFAEASREMLQSGNYVVPTFNHAPRYAKPPLIYWTQAASFCVLGESAFAARLPSLLATAGTAWLLLVWGAELAGVAAGLIAGLSYAFCLQTIQQGRAATADALLIFFTTLTAFAGWQLLRLLRDATLPEGIHSRARWNSWGFVLALAIAGGFLAKGPEALLPALPIFFLARGHGARVILALLAIVTLGLFLVAWWAIPAYVQTSGAYWREGLGHDVGDRMISGFQGHGANSLGWYLLTLPVYLLIFWPTALPWSPLIITRRHRLMAQRPFDAANVYLALNAAVFFVVFSLMVTKLPHYTLPAFPFLALLFARRWIAAGLPSRWPIMLGGGTGIALALIALIFIPAWLLPRANPSPAGTLVREVGRALSPQTEFALVDFQEPNTIWEMRRVARTYAQTISGKQAPAFLAKPGPRAILLTSALWKKLQARRAGAAPWQTFEARGWNAAKGSFLDLTLVVNQPASH